jgi:hypothetical protein
MKKIRLISATLDKLLENEKVKVYKTGIDISSYMPKGKTLEEDISFFKINQPKNARLHDVAAIDYIKKLRENKSVSQLDESKALFLTGDRILSKLNYESYHRDDNIISEVILDKLLTNLLWLNNPSIEIKLDALVASCCKEIFINRDIWKTFEQVFNELKTKGELTEGDYRSLFYLNYIGDVLAGYGQSDTGKITPEFVKKAVTDQKQDLEKMDDRLKNMIKILLLIFRISAFLILLLLSMMIAISTSLYKGTNIYIIIILYVIIVFLLFVLIGKGPFRKIWDQLIQHIVKKVDLHAKSGRAVF